MNYLRQFQYNEEITGTFIDTLLSHPNSPANAGKWLSHSLDALMVWVSRVTQIPPTVEVWQEHPADQLHALNREVHQAIFSLLERGNLHHVYTYQNSKGETFSSSLDEILTHLIIHSAHHRAQISSAWREAGIIPPVSDFIFWARGK
jgi:uncharacterized damage-inducible protein DinB